MVKEKIKIGLALGGGGARGLAHLGVLKVLEKEGIKIDYIAGVSMGSLIGAYYALGLDLKVLENDVNKLTKAVAIKKFLDLGASKKSILKGKKAYKFINTYLKGADFKDVKIPLKIVATDLASGAEVVLSKGDILNAARASTCVPGIFPPVEIDNRWLVDGGVVNPTPLNVVENMGADIIIGVDLISKRKIKLDNPGIVTTLMQSYEIIRTQAVEFNIKNTSSKAILIKPKLRGTIDSFKFYDIHKFIRSGEEAAKDMMGEIKKKIMNYR